MLLDCVRIAVEDGEPRLTKPVHGGDALTVVAPTQRPFFATVRGRCFPAAAAALELPALRTVQMPAPSDRVRVVAEEPASGPRLQDATRIVSGGRGIPPERWSDIEDAAAALDGIVGASRPVVDVGTVKWSSQVGLTGTSVAPDLYLAVGISGAVHHLAGIQSAKNVVAINRDPGAPIFRRAALGVVGDAREVLPAFTRRVRELCSGR